VNEDLTRKNVHVYMCVKKRCQTRSIKCGHTMAPSNTEVKWTRYALSDMKTSKNGYGTF